MTLAEALATGRPFKHKNQSIFYQKNHYATFLCNEMYDPVWQVQEEEKPPMRVWTDSPINSTIDLKDLAKALAPYLKGIDNA